MAKTKNCRGARQEKKNVKRIGNPEDLTDKKLYELFRYGIGQCVMPSIDDIAFMYGVDRREVKSRLWKMI